MAVRHWSGRGLGGEEIKPGAPPPAAPVPMPSTPITPTRMPVVEPVPDVRDPVGTVDGFAVSLLWGSGERVEGVGDTPEAAFADARVKYEAAQPIQPLIWSDGTPVEGLARQLLVEALETYSQYVGETAPAEIILMVGRLFASLGETR